MKDLMTMLTFLLDGMAIAHLIEAARKKMPGGTVKALGNRTDNRRIERCYFFGGAEFVLEMADKTDRK